tara:strand:- start:2799 stop:3248 length:450 start_codon:yes stop_codon:yes gene_type:complete
MKKICLALLFILTSCGFEPIYLNKDITSLEFKKISLEGDENINKKIINGLKLKENTTNENLSEVSIQTLYNINEASKNSKGIVETYITSLSINLNIIKNDGSLTNKNFVKNFLYNNKNNKFELVKYQQEIKQNLIDEIIKEIVLFLNVQ